MLQQRKKRIEELHLMAHEPLIPASAAKLIIADDHKLLRESMRSMLLVEPSLRVTAEARDGQEAIDLCRLHHPDLVLMDASMPKVNGLEAAQAIKEELPATKVIIVSAEHIGDTEVVRRGAEGFVSKLALVDDLLDTIRGVLKSETQHP
jgi:DNA-binding NarL/FixJ family response regulator